MKLQELLRGVDVKSELFDANITSLAGDSRQVEAGSAFFCTTGMRFDGHDYAEKAVEQGAAVVVCERDLGLKNQILVADTREALGQSAANFFGNPEKKLKLVAVTGTNGKTTTTYLIKHILEAAGETVGLIGTIHNEIDDVTLPSKYTTPDPIQLHAMFARMAEAGCGYVVMEASSHALDQKRLAGCRFRVAAFTNLTQDHLDYHGSMEEYYAAKRSLFAMSDHAVINIDDDYGARMMGEITCAKASYAMRRNDADFTAHDINFSAKGSRFAMMDPNGGIHRVSIRMPGYFSVANAMAAAVTCVAAGIPIETVAEGLASCPGIPGRIEILPTETPYTVIRDYAHSPDGLQKILETVREFAPARVVCLFGAAGNRDRTKRPIMGEIVSRLADFVIVTSDNPRDEDPEQIITDVIPGIEQHKTHYIAITDRYEAIKWALENARDDDVVVLAGKGHEDYQVLHYGTINFDEKVIVGELLAKMRDDEGKPS